MGESFIKTYGIEFMDYYLENIKILKEREPELVSKLEKIYLSPLQNLSYPEISLDNLSTSNYDLIVFFGFGCGFQIREALFKTSRKSLILVIDHDLENFKNVLANFDLREILKNERVSISLGEEPTFATKVRLERYYQVLTIRDIAIVDLYQGRVNQGYYEEIRKSLNEVLSLSLQNIATMAEFASVWEKNILENIQFLIFNPGLNSLKKKFKNYPVIIVSAGPSLDKNISILPKAKDKAIIICVDTALKPLLSQGISPNLVVSIDPKEETSKHFQNQDLKDLALVAEPGISPSIFSLFKNNLIFISSFGHPLIVWLENILGNKGLSIVGGSVSTSAFYIAKEIGGNPLIFIGQDLSFDEERIYAQETFYSESWINMMDKFNPLETIIWKKLREDNLLFVEGNFKERVLTNIKMASWIEWFGYQFKNTSALCINATEGGAKINNCLVMSLNQVLDKYCRRNLEINKRLKEIHKEYKPPKIERLIKEMEILRENFQYCFHLTSQALEIINLLKKDPSLDMNNIRVLNYLKHIYNLYENLKSIEDVLWISRWHIEPLLAKINSQKVNSVKDQIEIYSLFFEKLSKVSLEIKEELSKAISRLN